MTQNILDNFTQQIISNMQRYMKFLAITFIILGILNCLTLIGAILGVPILIMGLRLKDSANNFDYFIQTQDENYLKEALLKQAIFFKIYYFFAIILLIIIILTIILQLFFIAHLKNLIVSEYDLAFMHSLFGTID